jgi:hypothetical protein
MRNGTNLVCPKGTESERGSWCLGQCQVNLANKLAVSVLNPVKDVVGITSLSVKDANSSYNADTLGSENLRLHPGYVEGQST